MFTCIPETIIPLITCMFTCIPETIIPHLQPVCLQSWNCNSLSVYNGGCTFHTMIMKPQIHFFQMHKLKNQEQNHASHNLCQFHWKMVWIYSLNLKTTHSDTLHQLLWLTPTWGFLMVKTFIRKSPYFRTPWYRVCRIVALHSVKLLFGSADHQRCSYGTQPKRT